MPNGCGVRWRIGVAKFSIRCNFRCVTPLSRRRLDGGSRSGNSARFAKDQEGLIREQIRLFAVEYEASAGGQGNELRPG